MIFNEDCLLHLKLINVNSIDSLITDPPAGIGFMNKDWDGAKGGSEQWISWLTEIMQECLRVLKPGAHGLVWALPRTSHRTAKALEDAGFEIRDIVNHIFGSGFPKSLDVSKAIDKAAGADREMVGIKKHPTLKGERLTEARAYQRPTTPLDDIPITAPATDEAKQWQGWGTALKPAHEHWILVRKPLSEKTIAANVLKWNTGGLNIDASRIEAIDQDKFAKNWDRDSIQDIRSGSFGCGGGKRSGALQNDYSAPTGRFPSNLVLSEDAAKELDDHSGMLKSGSGNKSTRENNGVYQSGHKPEQKEFAGSFGGASRFFYVAKASKSDKGADNVHPTVKSTKLMEYLIKLITPPGGIVLDPFMGSGSTGVAAKRLGFEFIGIEKEKEYFDIAYQRIV